MSRYVLKTSLTSSHRILASWLNDLPAGARVLELGAGPALIRQASGRNDLRWFALDQDLRCAAELRRSGAVAWIGDLLDHQKFPPDVDAIILGDVLEHLPDPVPILTALRPSLAPGGRMLISVPNVAHWWLRLSLLAGRFEYAERGLLDRGHLRFFTARFLDQVLAASGLQATRRAVSGVPYGLTPASRVPVLVWVMEGVERVGLRVAPTLFGYQLLVGAAPV